MLEFSDLSDKTSQAACIPNNHSKYSTMNIVNLWVTCVYYKPLLVHTGWTEPDHIWALWLQAVTTD